ncbi:MAG: carboxylesterase family protein, partial [Parvularculaceae bacterium]|nr:carboxylesterase family protein [Parvularculaceae bacterium]
MRFLPLVFLLLAACAHESEPKSVPATETRRETTLGPVVGAIAENGAHVWRAIPYASPPVGALRWRAPQAAAPWSDDRTAVAAGPRCPQLTSPLNRIKGKKPGALIGAEDCLTLDVYAPKDALAQGALLPVMLWIHGGSNVWGGADQYDGARLAANENVVVVVAQYRLGVLGYFSHPLLRNAAETEDDKAANFGVLDLVAALAFVRDNAAAFGGDPARVTIFGESAGGHNVATLLAAPQAKRLFSRAIIQSGSFDSVPAADAEGAKAATRDLPNTAHDVASALGAETAEALRAAPVETLFKALKLTPSGYLELPTIIEDGVVAPREGLRAHVASGAPLNAAAVITGTNKDEIKLFQIAD